MALLFYIRREKSDPYHVGVLEWVSVDVVTNLHLGTLCENKIVVSPNTPQDGAGHKEERLLRFHDSVPMPEKLCPQCLKQMAELKELEKKIKFKKEMIQ